MSAEEHPVEYLALEALEDEFEDVEVEIRKFGQLIPLSSRRC